MMEALRRWLAPCEAAVIPSPRRSARIDRLVVKAQAGSAELVRSSLDSIDASQADIAKMRDTQVAIADLLTRIDGRKK